MKLLRAKHYRPVKVEPKVKRASYCRAVMANDSTIYRLQREIGKLKQSNHYLNLVVAGMRGKPKC